MEYASVVDWLWYQDVESQWKPEEYSLLATLRTLFWGYQAGPEHPFMWQFRKPIRVTFVECQ